MKRPWTDEELAILRRLAPTRPISHVARQLSRSIGSVRGAAQKHGIQFNNYHPPHAANHPWRRPVTRAGHELARKRA